MILIGLFSSILRCVGFRECSRTTSTLRFAKTIAPCLEKNILTQKSAFDTVCSCIKHTLRFPKNAASRTVRNNLAQKTSFVQMYLFVTRTFRLNFLKFIKFFSLRSPRALRRSIYLLWGHDV